MVDVKVKGNMFITKGDGTLRDTYKIGKVLGEGAFGEVRLCTHRESGEKRAVKVLKKVDMEQEEIDAMLNEINILRGVDHPNIVKIFEYFEDAKRFYIVTQHIEGGELFDSIIKFGTFSEHDAAVLTRQMLSVISYCHNRNIVHRDLKPENIMLESEKSYEDIKIIDFGTAQVFDPSKHLKEQIGTPYYIAPEVLNKKYGKECDIWSSGVIVFILLSGIPPFNGVTDNEIMSRIKKGKFDFNAKVWSSVSAEAKDFISQLLTLDASKRPTAEQAMQHPWLVKQSKVEVNEEQTKDALAHLTMFHKNNTLKTATFSFIGSQLISKDEKEGLAKVFKTLDRNGDGRLSKDEVQEGYMAHYGKLISDDEVNKMFEAVDTDNSGYIDYTEFIVAAINEKQLTSHDKLKAAFRMFDKDNSGMITPSEIRDVFAAESSLPAEIIDTIIKAVDANGDGEISLEEFIELMKKASDQ